MSIEVDDAPARSTTLITDANITKDRKFFSSRRISTNTNVA